ncbi:protein mono-ADP-ribosyltransferase PARP15-like [Oculina patagonica]
MWNDEANLHYPTQQVLCLDDEVEYIWQYRMPQIKAIQRKLRGVEGAIEVDDGIFVTARSDGINWALQLVNELLDKVVRDDFEIEQPGITTFCAKGRMDSLLRIVQNEEKCYVRVEQGIHQPSAQPSGSSPNGSAVAGTGSPSTNSSAGGAASAIGSSVSLSTDSFFVTPQGQKISWTIGDIAKEQAHTLVSPQGVCSKAIFSAAGPNITKIYQAPQPGEITITPGYLLACSHVIHTCCSKWDGGNGEATLRSIVQKSLVKVTELGGSSVAFPVIGTGNLAFPPHEASRIMLDEAVKFCQNNPHSLVKEIRFVLFHGDQAVIDAFKQESTALQTKNRKTVEVVQGDLTQETTDAIVNIIGTDMNICGAGELGKAVAKASGAQVEDECSKLGQQSPGSAVLTSGGNLAVPNIIHMVVNSSTVQHLQLCVEKCLQLADAKGMKKISLPAVGTGASRLSEVVSAQAMFQALRNVLNTCVNLRQVRIVLYQAKFMEAFQKEQKLMEQRENKQPVPSPPSVKTEEPPKKKPRMTLYGGVPDLRNKDRVKIYITGPSKAAVKRATDTLTRGITEAFTTQTVQQQGIGKLSKKQIDGLQKQAQACDVKLEIDQSTSRIVVRGEHSSVAEMIGKIWGLLNERILMSRVKERAKLSTTTLPTNWDPMPRNQAGNDVTVHTVNLSPMSQEYQDVAVRFQQTTGSVALAIVSIERIQNPHLYQAYQLRKVKMDKDNGGTNERLLFHGTNPDSVTKINTQGFNRSFAGLNGSAFGKGVYFARDAAYSYGYAARSGASVGNRCMYLSRVLVGQYCTGAPPMIVPPPKDPSRPEILFDSVVDDTGNPTIFVVFFDNQCYPEYLIKF